MFDWLIGGRPKVLDMQAQSQLMAAQVFVEGFGVVTWLPGTHLLQSLESAGISVRTSCRRGNCGACVAEVLEGKLGYLHEVGFESKKGEVLLCAAVPIGTVRIRLGAKVLR